MSQYITVQYITIYTYREQRWVWTGCLLTLWLNQNGFVRDASLQAHLQAHQKTRDLECSWDAKRKKQEIWNALGMHNWKNKRSGTQIQYALGIQKKCTFIHFSNPEVCLNETCKHIYTYVYIYLYIYIIYIIFYTSYFIMLIRLIYPLHDTPFPH